MTLKVPNKYQRILKLKIIKKCFDILQFKYSVSHDVYEVFYEKKLIHAAFAYRNVQQIIDEIRIKYDKLVLGYYK